ncbi:hypothetical protein WK78_03100 [Burkholderia cepacia]|uniref:hypothetical protein n=1 Tax=Burkholderia cepacia TaxID=292 RepID=UPI0007571DE6|nr:hypothetical protein [Burkholderia cepacia]KVV25095.1 hypothetical protein WK78_03100 [Burkholderia cepacia]
MANHLRQMYAGELEGIVSNLGPLQIREAFVATRGALHGLEQLRSRGITEAGIQGLVDELTVYLQIVESVADDKGVPLPEVQIAQSAVH